MSSIYKLSVRVRHLHHQRLHGFIQWPLCATEWKIRCKLHCNSRKLNSNEVMERCLLILNITYACLWFLLFCKLMLRLTLNWFSKKMSYSNSQFQASFAQRPVNQCFMKISYSVPPIITPPSAPSFFLFPSSLHYFTPLSVYPSFRFIRPAIPLISPTDCLH